MSFLLQLNTTLAVKDVASLLIYSTTYQSKPTVIIQPGKKSSPIYATIQAALAEETKLVMCLIQTRILILRLSPFYLHPVV